MIDQFREEVVTRRKRGIESLLIVLATISMIVSGLIAMVLISQLLTIFTQEGLSSNFIFWAVMALLFTGFAILTFLNKDKIRTEYEYTFTNGTMDFAQVFNNKKRKALGTMNIRNVEACGMVDSGSFRRSLNIPGVTRLNWFLNREANLFYFYFVKDSKKTLMVLEPSEEMINLIKKNVGQGKFQTN